MSCIAPDPHLRLACIGRQDLMGATSIKAVIDAKKPEGGLRKSCVAKAVHVQLQRAANKLIRCSKSQS